MHDDDRYAHLETTDASGSTLRNRVWFATGPTPGEPTVAVFSAGEEPPVWLERMLAGAAVAVVLPDGSRHRAAFRRPGPGSFDHDAHLARLAHKYPTNVRGAPVEWTRDGQLVVLELLD